MYHNIKKHLAVCSIAEVVLDTELDSVDILPTASAVATALLAFAKQCCNGWDSCNPICGQNEVQSMCHTVHIVSTFRSLDTFFIAFAPS